MSIINDIFDALAGSVYETFLCHNGVCGFRIPIYQRKYDWSKENINRMLDDIVNGIISHQTDEASLTFLGTIILVNEGGTKEDTFNGYSLSIVDGQQRLTTLAILFSILQREFLELKENIRTIAIESTDARDWLESEIDYQLDSLFDCIVGKPSSSRIITYHRYFPRIVRQISDNRGTDARSNEYRSLIGKYLFDFGRSVYEKNNFEFVPYRDNDDFVAFNNNIEVLSNLIKQLITGEGALEKLPSVEDLLLNRAYKTLYKKLNSSHALHEKSSRSLINLGEDSICQTVRLLIFSNYLLDKVALTRVEADDEKYAFDIFEALNTTGEPLTAIETFKPRVIEFEESNLDEGYQNSTSYDHFKNIDDYLSAYRKNDARQTVSRDLVVSFALYMTGEKVSNHLARQRKYLRNGYDNIGNNIENRKKYVEALNSIVDYKSKFWDIDGIDQQLYSDEDRELILFCLDFIRDIKTSLSIPILCRYYTKAIHTDDLALFKNAVKAFTAFLVIRRAATGGTKGIDSDFRDLMCKGGKNTQEQNYPLMIGLDFTNQLPDVESFSSYLRSYLNARRLGIVNKESWINYAANQPLYESTSPLCRFMLLTAAHNSRSIEDSPWLLEKIRSSNQLNYMKLSAWKRDEFESVEHIAPDSREEGWDNSIYNEPTTKHTLGNLCLLPKNENSHIGNKSWEIKKLYYQAFSAESEQELENAFKVANDQGVSFGEKVELYLKNNTNCLPTIASIAKTESWNREIIQERSKNIAELVWNELASWIHFEE